jgi:uncharacterized membrane protein YdbT with pleckstrin-like domain
MSKVMFIRVMIFLVSMVIVWCLHMWWGWKLWITLIGLFLVVGVKEKREHRHDGFRMNDRFYDDPDDDPDDESFRC